MKATCTELQNFELNRESLANLIRQELPSLLWTLRSDVEEALHNAYESEQNERARSMLEMLIENACIAKESHKPLCQDTGTVRVMVEVGKRCAAVPADLFSDVDDAVAEVYIEHFGRKSVLKNAILERVNTNNNTPAFCELSFIDGNKTYVHLMLKGGGSDNASRVVMLPPGAGVEGVKKTVLEAISEKAASACPPVIVGVGVGSTFDAVPRLAKHALLRDVGSVNDNPELAALEEELCASANELGIGPGGFGGNSTALAIHLETSACHIAALPVAVNICCSAMRSASFVFGDEADG